MKAFLAVLLLFAATAVAQRVDTAALSDGNLHVILCGTGSPLPDAERAGSCTAILAAGQVILVDSGPGSWRKAMLSQVPGAMLTAVFLTHFHSDHIGDLGEAMTMSWVNGRAALLDVYGPEGIDGIAKGFNEVYSLDKDYRVAHHSDQFVPAKAHDLVPHTVHLADANSRFLIYEKKGLKVFAFAVDHRPVEPAFGYRVEYAGRSVVVTGDTAACENVARQAQGADILIHDSMAKNLVNLAAGALDMQGQKRTAKMLRDTLTYHASTLEAAQAAADAKVGTLVLSHQVPVPGNFGGEQAFLKGVPEIFPGKVVFAKDGLRFDLQAAAPRP